MKKQNQQKPAVWQRVSPWVFRIPVGVVLAAILVLQAGRIDRFGSALVYAASWIILLHVMIGEYVFIRYLHAVSRNQQLLDGFAALLLLGGIFSFRRAALWCAFLAGAFALAITKYLLVEQHLKLPALRNYVREKILLESPAVCLFSIFAVVIDRLPVPSATARVIELFILVSSALFAFWMIGIRHIYRRVANAR